jgi:endonuclease/exonuclease/phosphatase (EEP) superfamily protein YafD
MKYLKTIIKDINKNIILMGDLNMTSSSKRFTNFLRETNLYTYISYKYPTVTWPTYLPNFVGIQIDHVLFSKNFNVVNKMVAEHIGSDHRPLVVDLVF